MHLHEEAARCLFCADAPCSKVCKNADPARAIRAIRFDNEELAGKWLGKAAAAVATRPARTAAIRPFPSARSVSRA